MPDTLGADVLEVALRAFQISFFVTGMKGQVEGSGGIRSGSGAMPRSGGVTKNVLKNRSNLSALL